MMIVTFHVKEDLMSSVSSPLDDGTKVVEISSGKCYVWIFVKRDMLSTVAASLRRVADALDVPERAVATATTE